MIPTDDHSPDQPRWPQTLSCTHCRHEIPPDEVLHPEGADYTLAFCSARCHDLWRAGRRAEQPPRPGGESNSST
ncbi:hypothetical protein Thiosp_03226 [Thiorhodovibrio litoralis]|nr:hypothetical protein Thiosp_03226 [Thiorhodovibrio litoralis]